MDCRMSRGQEGDLRALGGRADLRQYLRPVPKLIITKGLRENLLLHQVSLDKNLPSRVDLRSRLRG